MATWDVFHSDRLEVERGLDDAALRAAIARGEVKEDDLVRPAGSGSAWERLGDRPDLAAALAPAAEPPTVAQPDAPTVAQPGAPTAGLPTDPLAEAEWDVAEIRGASRPGEDGGDFESVDPEGSDPAVFGFAKDPKPPEADAEGLEFLDEDEPGADAEVEGLEFLEDDAPPADAEVEGLEFLDDEAPGAAAPPPDRPRGPILPPYEPENPIPVPGPAPLPWDAEVLEAEFDDEDEFAQAIGAEGDGEYDPLEEDEAVAEFTLSRDAAETVEELDLAAMVDVAFQLVLFFLVTATTVFYKSLEVPAPKPDKPPDAAQQARAKTLDELMQDEILVEIDPAGTLKIDRQVVPGELTMEMLAGKLRQLRNDTGRKGMLLSADFTTPHRLTTLAYDAANEVGMNIKIASPTNKAAAPPPAAKKG